MSHETDREVIGVVGRAHNKRVGSTGTTQCEGATKVKCLVEARGRGILELATVTAGWINQETAAMLPVVDPGRGGGGGMETNIAWW